MGLADSFRKHRVLHRWVTDLVLLPVLGGTAYLLFRASSLLRPGEAAALMMAAGGLVMAGHWWFAWQRDMTPEGFLSDWASAILQGDRSRRDLPAGMKPEIAQISAAMNALVEDCNWTAERLEALQQATAREWVGLDGLLAQAHQQRQEEQAARSVAMERLGSYGRDIKKTIEGTLRFDQIELNQRLRADQHRLQEQAFRAALEQAQSGLERLEFLLEELQDTFPRLRREEDSMGRLADASHRQGARLGLAVMGLAAHTPRLLEETKARTDQFQRFRKSADGVRDDVEALARRIEAFRAESQNRAWSFGGAQGAIQAIDQAAQQTGLLAVNAAILAQQGSGTSGMQAIGGRLRGLADQTSRSASDLERALDQHERGMEREHTGLWDLQEVTQRLLSGVEDLLRVAAYLDQQGRDLERALETHLGLVDQVRQASDRAELSLFEVGERSKALETALGRQRSVEAKAALDMEQLSRVENHLMEAGGDLVRISRQNIDEIWEILAGHQELRRSEAYRQIASGDLSLSLRPDGAEGPVWNRLAWARNQRRPRLLEGTGPLPPQGRRGADGRGRLRLLGLDALGAPEASALEDWSCDEEGRTWNLRLAEGLVTEEHRIALLEALKESPLEACLPGTRVRVSPDGVDVHLPFPYPGLPRFLAGLCLELPVNLDEWREPFREAPSGPLPVQTFLWCGPNLEPSSREGIQGLVHAWVLDDPRCGVFLPWLPREGQGPLDLWAAEESVEARLDGRPRIHCLGLGTDPASLYPMRDRLVQAGAEPGEGGAVLGAASLGHAHPEALLLRIFQTGTGLADSPHPDLVPFRSRFQLDVLGARAADPYRAAWDLLEDLRRKGWLLPLPPV